MRERLLHPAAIPLLAAAWCCAGAAFAQDFTQDAASAVTRAAAVAEMGSAPLLLRIRPRDEAPEDGSGLDAVDAAREAEASRLAAAARAVAAREAFEARITARANRAIASVCTGCLGPAPARPVPASVAMTEP